MTSRSYPGVMTQEPHEPWHRQRGETDKAYEAFRVYLEEGTLERVTKRLYPHHSPRSPIATTVQKWSAKYDWVERRRAWVVHTKKSFDLGAAEAAREQGYDWAAKKTAIDVRLSEAIGTVLDRVAEMAAAPAFKITEEVVTSRYEDGREKTVHLHISEPCKWTAGNIAELLKVAHLINREVIAPQVATDFDSAFAAEDALVREIEQKILEFRPGEKADKASTPDSVG